MRRQKPVYIVILTLFMLLNSSISSPALHALETGMEAPDFTLSDLAARQHSFSTLKGDKLTVVLFWASWGDNSAKALKLAQSLHQTYKGRGLAVVGINVDRQEMTEQSLSAVKATLAKQQIGFPVLLDQGLNTFQRFGVIAVPSLVVLDSQRVIRYELSGFPLMGADAFKQFIVAGIEGRSAVATTATTGYQPDKKAVRLWHMGVTTMKSERTFSRAGGWFEKAIVADPEFTQPYLSLGAWHYQQRNLTEARKQFELVLQKKSDHPVALSSLGRILMEQGDMTAAEQKLVKAVASNESYLPGYYLMGTLKGKQGNLQKALYWFSKGESLSPNDYTLHFHKGMMFEELQDQSAALASYRRALELIVGQP